MFQLTPSQRRSSSLLVLVVAVTLAMPALSGDDDPKPPSRKYARVGSVVAAADTTVTPPPLEPPSQPTTSALPEYRPPRRGAPRAKIGGGRRGIPALPTPLVLAPGHLAQTVAGRPSLFWHIDAVPSQDSSVIFTLIDEGSIDPIVEAELSLPKQAGIQRIRLVDHGVKLQPGIEYEWSVALVVDPSQRSKDVVSTGYIRRISEPSELRLRPPCVTSYADLGLWYDALESVSDAIDSVPGDLALRSQRSSLLHQVGLDAAIE
jgi:hypothetical protein